MITLRSVRRLRFSPTADDLAALPGKLAELYPGETWAPVANEAGAAMAIAVAAEDHGDGAADIAIACGWVPA